MFRWLRSESSRCTPRGQEKALRFLVPENASLAQSLLQIILDNAQIEMFSPDGGGVAVMLLERWQIDLLAGFGICFEESPMDAVPPQEESFEAPPHVEPEYLEIANQCPDTFQEILGQLTSPSTKDDILSEWLSLERRSGMADAPLSQ